MSAEAVEQVWTTATAAVAFARAGCSVVRARCDGSKAPVGGWKPAQTRAAPPSEVADAFRGGHPGVGIVTGAVSGNLEMLEFEGRAIAEQMHVQLADLAGASGLGELWERLSAGYRETTPSGGVHLVFRVDGAPVLGNTKLASRPATADELAANPAERVKVLIETRGEGGFVVVAPSCGPVHLTGRPWVRQAGGPDTIPTITAEEYRALHDLARALDQMPQPAPPAPRPVVDQPHGQERPGDRFNRLASWQDLLTPHGWTALHEHGGTLYWRRPGKAAGVSATTGRNEHDRLYVFSTSTEFEANRPYDKLGALALLEHGGDVAAAARAIAADPRYRADRPLDLGRRPHALDRPAAPPPAPALTPPLAADPPAAVDPIARFWAVRPSLQQVHDVARARRCSPWAVLGVLLVRVATSVPPFVVLPPLVGSVASLNLFCALVGPSGSGKGAAEGAAADAVDVGDVYTSTAGSGEGIAHLYAHRDRKGDLQRDRDAVLLTVPEVDNLTALGARQGSTLLPVLRSAWSGERLGFANADRNRSIPLARHSYRLGLVLGVQPGRAGTLLGDSDGGTPQRFLWMPATDPGAPDVRPPMPPRRRLRKTPWHANSDGQAILTVPQVAADTIDQAHLARARGDGDALDGHALLCRLKTAQALALLDDRHDMTDEDWQLASLVMAASDRTRGHVTEQLAAANARANLARGQADGLRAAVAEEVQVEQSVQRTCRTLTRRLQTAEGRELARADLRRAVAARDRQHYDQAVQRLLDAGQLQETTTAQGTRLSLQESAR